MKIYWNKMQVEKIIEIISNFIQSNSSENYYKSDYNKTIENIVAYIMEQTSISHNDGQKYYEDDYARMNIKEILKNFNYLYRGW